ncbi:hypothetical protein TNCV_1407391 [Trichonephila clavipes]|nr:hypothetical protein TNCV_1407391 [Trichonephila clavipes]
MSEMTNIDRETIKNIGQELAYGESWRKTGTERLDQDTAPIHFALSVKLISTNKRIICSTIHRTHKISPHTISICFLKEKNALNGAHFQSVEEAKSKATDELKMVPPNKPRHCFER